MTGEHGSQLVHWHEPVLPPDVLVVWRGGVQTESVENPRWERKYIAADVHEALRSATRELVKLAEGYADTILEITGSVDGFLVIDCAKEALGDV